MNVEGRKISQEEGRYELKLSVNGVLRSLMVKADAILLDVLRNDLGLTGARRGCESNFCGACTVLLDGQAIHSCSVLALTANNKSVVTIEGLSQDGKLHPLQESFIQHGAIQCGYCTPGMILSAKALLDEDPEPAESKIRESIAGNLCRCTGYKKIVQSVLAVAQGNQTSIEKWGGCNGAV